MRSVRRFLFVLALVSGLPLAMLPLAGCDERAAHEDSASEAPPDDEPAREAPPADRAGGDVPSRHAGERPPGGDTATPSAAGSIVLSVYGFLERVGDEPPGYGLYSYVLFPHHSPRAEAFLARLFRTTTAASQTPLPPAQLNLIHLPARPDAGARFGSALLDLTDPPVAEFAREGYDYPFAESLLVGICRRPQESLEDLCAGNLARGPYLFTYTQPASHLHEVPPPYLFVDLSDVHPDAFAEFISAYKAQVKRTDITDRERIDTFRLRLLDIVLVASDWIAPVTKSVKDIVHLVRG